MNTILESEIQEKINNKTKPQGSLGLLEDLAFKICRIQNTTLPSLDKPVIVVFAGDHGIADSNVSAYPKEVTYQMVLNFLRGGAAINVFTNQHNIQLIVVNAGVSGDFNDFSTHDNFIDMKVCDGTRNSTLESSMSSIEVNLAIQRGRIVARDFIASDCNIIGFGEMGIGNTSSASLLMSAILNIPLEDCVGKGTGLDDIGVKKKVQTLNIALERCRNLNIDIAKPMIALQEFGGIEIAMMIGCMMESFEMNRILLIDGFIATAALLVASRLESRIINNCIFCHLSNEKAHKQLLDFLGVEPILNLRMRLGEGTGCAVAYPIIQSSIQFLNNMASFQEAGVSELS